MPTTITEPSKELITRLLRESFEKIDFSMEYIYNKAGNLINTAKELGMNDLAEELENDLKTVA